MTCSFDESDNLPQDPGIYGFKSPTDVKKGSSEKITNKKIKKFMEHSCTS